MLATHHPRPRVAAVAKRRGRKTIPHGRRPEKTPPLAILLLLGTGPLLTIMAIAKLGLTKDPDPNPIAFGMLAGITFWPSIIMLAIGVFRSTR